MQLNTVRMKLNTIKYSVKLNHGLKLCGVQTSIFRTFFVRGKFLNQKFGVLCILFILNVCTTNQTPDSKSFLLRRKIEV